MIVEPCDERAAEWHNWNGSGRLKPGNQSNEVAGKNEQSKRDQVGHILFVAVADDFASNTADETFDPFNNMLKAAGAIDR